MSPDVWADLREVGNIGAGNAAAKLADVIHRRCMISLPTVFSVDSQSLIHHFGAQESIVTGQFVKISGDVPANILVLLKRQHAHTVVRYATDSGIDGTGKDFTFTAQFALRQLADGLAESFTKGVNELLGSKTKRGAGKFIVDVDASLVKAILTHLPAGNTAPLAISCDFYDLERSFEGKFLYFLEELSQDIVQRRIAMLLKGVASPS